MPTYKAILLDIGTVCSISFVRDVLFPYAIAALPGYIRSEWDSPSFRPYRDAFPEDVRDSPEQLMSYVREVSEKDIKVSCLKQLQGLIWESGYRDGAYQAPIYPDVFPAIKHWSEELGLTVDIYSSGSVAAQKLLFQHTDAEVSDMTKYFSGYFDTVSAGPKTEAASYKIIAEKTGINAASWLFLSDNVKEVAAAKQAGMDAAIVVRPGNAPLNPEDKDAHRVVENGFDEVTAWI
ncbi:acireductone synthase-like protein [Morchella conica CCBAS932]|uniref:Acireductone synthase-like protein n=1 Tax=Morchella conica CCBAS932 TaxID=1392247 RepID=A0A3N4KLP7_9PEZI|nr:acireductone synthase-like protein [Morchella conica CCBAS932]